MWWAPRFTRVLIAAVLVVPMAMKVGLPARALDEPVTTVGYWTPTPPPNYTGPDYGASVYVYPDAGNRRLWAYSANASWLSAYDLDTLRQVGNGITASAGSLTTGYYADPVGGGMFIASLNTATQQVTLDEYVSRPAGVQRIGTMDLTAQLSGRRIVGMVRAPGTRLMWLLSGHGVGGANAPGGVTVSELDVDEFENGQATAHKWSVRVDACAQTMHSNNSILAGLGYIPEKKALYFGCGNFSFFNAQPPTPHGAARLTLLADPSAGPTPTPSAAQFVLFPRAGNFNTSDSAFDPVSGRLVMTSYSPQTGSTVFVFDGNSDTYVGGIGAGGNGLSASTIDPVTGRFYFLSQEFQTGLTLTDIRATPPTQGAQARSYYARDKRFPSVSNLAQDPLTRRLFLKYDSFNDFVIVRDDYPPYLAPPGVDPDANTTDTDEAPGKTAAAYQAGVQAFGTRVTAVGGIQALVLNAASVDGVYPVGPGTREYRAAYLNRMRLTNNEASASAFTADTDRPNTKQDLNKTTPNPPDPIPPPPSTPLSPPSDQPLVTWPYSEALCGDFGDSPGEGESETARTSCHSVEHVVRASAASPRTEGADFVVADGSFDAWSKLDKDKGVVAYATATGRGISLLGGQLQIGEVTMIAKAWAKGRPKSADTEFTRIVRNVSLRGEQLCGENDCDINMLKDQINAAFVGVLQVNFPAADKEFLHGSDGGYQALVRVSPLDHLQDVLLNEQSEDRLEVSGMKIVLVQDGLKPGRTVIDLAGVQAEAHYGISVLDEFSDSEDILDALDAGGTTGVGEGPLFGIDPNLPDSFVPTVSPRSGGGGGGGGGSPLSVAGRYVLNGLRRAATLLPVWAVLLAPVYLSARRWLLLQRSALTRGEVR